MLGGGGGGGGGAAVLGSGVTGRKARCTLVPALITIYSYSLAESPSGELRYQSRQGVVMVR